MGAVRKAPSEERVACVVGGRAHGWKFGIDGRVSVTVVLAGFAASPASALEKRLARLAAAAKGVESRILDAMTVVVEVDDEC